MKKSPKKILLLSLGLGNAKKEDLFSLPLILLASSLVAVTVIIDLLINLPVYNSNHLIIGIIMFILGISIRLVSQKTLGKHFTLTVRIRKDHKLINKGIYRYVRHPMYTGFFIMFIGHCIAWQSLWGIYAVLIIFPPLGFHRVKIEEQALRKKLGTKYLDYMKKTKRFIPFIV